MIYKIKYDKQECTFLSGKFFKNFIFIIRAVRCSTKCLRKKPVRWIQKNMKNIWYSSYEPSKTGKCYTFLVSFIIPVLWPQWFMSPFVMQSKIFSKITHQTTLREAHPYTTLFFSEVGLRKFVLASELFVLKPYFICHLIAKRREKILWLALWFILRRR